MTQKKLFRLSAVCCVFFAAVLLTRLPWVLAQTNENDSSPNFLQVADGATLSDTVNAQNEFRIGVQAYYRYAFNEAILAFERANSFRPGEALILDWLGRAYYRSGMENTALRQWQFELEDVSSSEEILIRSRIEMVRNRRSLLPLMDDDRRFVAGGRYPGRTDSGVYFRQPSSVLVNDDGSVWVVAYGSNELLRVDVNGIIRQRVRGPANGFDRPYDMVRGIDGRYYVSEYRGGRVSILAEDGSWQGYVGSRGIEEGMFVGPQNMAVDDEGYLYVVDYGNRRVSKFDPDGVFILSFGKSDYDFGGFLSPTGICVLDDRVFVADGVTKQIQVFDKNGGFVETLDTEGLAAPESLRALEGNLLLADTGRILLVDPNSSITRELGGFGTQTLTNVRVTGAGVDSNGNIVAANFIGDEVEVMTSSEDMASGFFVQIDRVIADRFPLVTVEFSVQDRFRNPVLGLEGRNFLLTENSRAVSGQNFLGSYLSRNYDVSILMERSERTSALREDLAAAARDISGAEGNIISLVSAGEMPVSERVGEGMLAAASRAGDYSPRWQFDLGLRLSASSLLAGEKKRAVVFVTSAVLGELAFERYSLSELAAYLANNSIAFYAVVLGGAEAGDDIRYLCEETGGEVLDLYRPGGVGAVLKTIGEKGSGFYALSYQSGHQTNFGRNYLGVEVEVYLLERSGRDRIGYFAPLE
ncbi:MAG: NHL repeat-containing protein [Treponema sp.]|jgi:DNA-binding beta-propeller fold protein YncE|nr:NHL repeat-containing protein [Treponema sp.]